MVNRASAAVRRPAISEDDPAWRAALAAPLDDEPETEPEAWAIEEARREGRFVDGAVVSAEIAAQIARRA